MKKLVVLLTAFLLLGSVPAVPQKSATPSFRIEYEKFTLPNGLDVIFHIDRSDPVVAVSLTAHVGSAREKAGRTGFAHMFEHLLFLESENLGKGGLDFLQLRPVRESGLPIVAASVAAAACATTAKILSRRSANRDVALPLVPIRRLAIWSGAPTSRFHMTD